MMTEVSGTLLRTKSKSDMTCQWKNSHAPFVPPSSSKHPLHYTYPKTDRLIPLQGAWNLPMPSKSNCQHKTCRRSTHAQVIVLPKWDANPPPPAPYGRGSTRRCAMATAPHTRAHSALHIARALITPFAPPNNQRTPPSWCVSVFPDIRNGPPGPPTR